jgi:hypothetical protein
VQHVDFFASCPERHDLIPYLHDIGEADFVEALGYAQAAYFRGHENLLPNPNIKMSMTSISDANAMPVD